jgi:hypothetical protein
MPGRAATGNGRRAINRRINRIRQLHQPIRMIRRIRLISIVIPGTIMVKGITTIIDGT